MFDIIFPRDIGQRYYKIHFQYVLNIFKYLHCNIIYEDRQELRVTINKKDFLFDYGDSSEYKKYDLPTFKFHTKIEDKDKVYPFPPVSFYDWQQYNWLSKQIYYIPTMGFDISCRQKIYGGAIFRRYNVQKTLKDYFENDRHNGGGQRSPFHILTTLIDQVDYWREINKIDCAVFVPGYCNNMIDRAHLQYLAFGCYTISPHLPEVLPYGKMFLPGIHYDRCKDDYSDLIDIIMSKQINSNQHKYKEIGDNAKKLFQETCTHEKLGEYIRSKL